METKELEVALEKAALEYKEHYSNSYIYNFEKHLEELKNSTLRVWYGLRKLTKTAIKRKSIIIIYENSWMFQNEKSVKQKMHVVFERKQVNLEKIDALFSSRVFTFYEYFFDLKKHNRRDNKPRKN